MVICGLIQLGLSVRYTWQVRGCLIGRWRSSGFVFLGNKLSGGLASGVACFSGVSMQSPFPIGGLPSQEHVVARLR